MNKWTIHECHRRLTAKEISATELTQTLIRHKERTEPDIHAYLADTHEEALRAAAEVDRKIAAGETVSPLAGVPGAIKDNMCIQGLPTTAASRMLEHFVPPYDATVIERLRAADFVSLGKVNMDEFAMGSSTENSAFGPSRNPWNTDRVPGGSSGGSAAAVAANTAIWSLGSDTGGSIRQPAAYCGLVGLKPTYGLVSRYGLLAFSSSLDQIGPITKDVTDCALVLNAIAGYDPKDSTSIPSERPDYTQALRADVKGLKIGVPEEFFGEGIAPAAKEAVQNALKFYEEQGAEIVPVSLPRAKYAISAYYIIAPAEAGSNLARYDGVGFGLRVEGDNLIEMYKKSRSAGFGPEVQRRILLGTYVLSAGYYDSYYLKALQVRTLIKQDMQAAFEQVDLLVTPTVPGYAFRFGEKTDNPLAMYMEDVCTVPVNLAGVPAISIPCGFADRMPLGMQIIGPVLAEETVLRAAYTFEQAHPEYTRTPERGEVKE
ncbi:MAG: Asp-tRNA(Asn)/Glu-tRNA(Gln) amidotransferase subunit GatA [Veillonellaceae bacterium]|nr:Asp-tRNA(Asn)/Glu-tRNA(Gln) amidotransferase subunit GatA [Veillonellaceae bacterium]